MDDQWSEMEAIYSCQVRIKHIEERLNQINKYLKSLHSTGQPWGHNIQAARLAGKRSRQRRGEHNAGEVSYNSNFNEVLLGVLSR